MPARKPAKPDSIRVIAAKLNMSLGHVRDAMKDGIDPHDASAMKAWKANRRVRVDERSDLSRETPPTDSPSIEMTLDEMERAIRAKGITVAEATVLKRQIEAMKQLVWVRRESKQLLSIQEVNARDVRIGAAVSAALRALENELPALCLGLPLERSRPLVKDRTRQIQAMLADELSAFWKENEPT